MIACFDMGGTRDGGGTRLERGEASDGPPRKGRARPLASHDAKSDANHEARHVARPVVGTAGPVRVERATAGSRFADGAPSVVLEGGPRPGDHPAGRSDAEIRELFVRKSRQREEGIQRLIELERADGKAIERFVAAIRYDSELATRTTNRRQLLELGIHVPAPDALPNSPDEVRHVLWTIIFGLARLGIFLTGTDAFDDRGLLSKLCGRVLVDEVSDIPPSADLSEFIDLAPAAEPDPDGLTGPFEFEPDADDVDGGDGLGRADPGKARAGDGTLPKAQDRDRFLPRPDRG